MKTSILALAAAAAISLAGAQITTAQEAVDTSIVDGCAVNTEGQSTESGVITPSDESLSDADADGGEANADDPCPPVATDATNMGTGDARDTGSDSGDSSSDGASLSSD